MNIATVINRRLLSVFFLGFSSGLPLALSGSTLQAWYTTAGVNIIQITLLGLLGLPYLYKFLWAPLFDRYSLPFLDRRRGWMVLLQLALIAILLAMALFSPAQQPYLVAIFGLVLAFFSASLDIAIDAYRAELLIAPERGLGAAYSVAGYRIGMIVSGAVAMILADSLGWKNTYFVMAVCMAVAMLATWWAPNLPLSTYRPKSLKESVVQSYKQFMLRNKAATILFFIILYKLGDAFTSSSGGIVTLFLLRELNLSLTSVGVINKGLGLCCGLAGIFLGGLILTRCSLYRALLIFGILQALSNLMFLLLAIAGKQSALVFVAIALENLCAGLCAAAFTAFLMSLCDQRFAATQFALFTALAAVARVILAPVAGMMINYAGWVLFFFITFLLALPGLLVLKYLDRKGIAKEFNYSV